MEIDTKRPQLPDFQSSSSTQVLPPYFLTSPVLTIAKEESCLWIGLHSGYRRYNLLAAQKITTRKLCAHGSSIVAVTGWLVNHFQPWFWHYATPRILSMTKCLLLEVHKRQQPTTTVLWCLCRLRDHRAILRRTVFSCLLICVNRSLREPVNRQ